MISKVGNSNLSFSGIHYVKWGQDAQLISRKLEPEKLVQHVNPAPSPDLIDAVRSSGLLQSLGKVTEVYISTPNARPYASGLEGTVSASFKMPGHSYKESADRLNIKAKSLGMEGLYGNFKKVLSELPETISDLREQIKAVPKHGVKVNETPAGSWSIVRGD